MAFLNSTIIFEAGGKRYVTTEAIAFQSQDGTPLKSQPVTVFANHSGVPLSKEWLKTYLNKLVGCDVYDSKLFLSGVIITTPHRGQTVPQDPWDYLKELGMKWLEIVVEGGGKHLPTGPYFYTDNKLHSVCRLYDDEKGAFFSGLVPKLDLLTTDAVDYPTAFNPRGDGYQSPAGSSSGSAAAVAAYDWLDCAIGTDTSGSGRRPALANGVWQFRPSHDSVSLRGLVKTYAIFDTSCVFARSVDVIRRVARSWIAAPSLDKKRPYRLIYPLDYLPTENPEQMKIIDSFIRDVETHLPATVIPLSIRSSWQQSHPPGTPADVEEYLKDVIRATFYHQFYHSTENFRQLYAERHDGQQPYVIPFVQRRWALGASVSDAEHEEATRRLLVYKKWLRDQLFGDEKFETLVILPVAEVKPSYRDEKVESPENQSARDELFLSPILGAPDVVIPIGDMSYHSKISNKIEYLPVVANLVAAPGRHHELLEAVQVILERSKRPKVVSTGSRIGSPGYDKVSLRS
ncbi:amidase signature domain protein [Fusarium tjaetaba]|uniref:Amidase signature domain protein n=1 Tax=Fusarium tjaetaba TaxID=1567544 RepID=A0A8H5VIL8_9HYPO|nr:amidase signature domain protein [Fusarium tjaetaba]KAF5622384.1 amidase signature domain protein [Fusarium tjaetaba]